MGNFDINTSFNMLNSLDEFNKRVNGFNNFTFSKNDNKLETPKGGSFGEILNSVTEGAKNVSETQKTAQDIGLGFKNGINELNQIQRKYENDFETFASGGDISIHEVMISAQKSSLAMQTAIQLRNQMLNAYNEFKNMQL